MSKAFLTLSSTRGPEATHTAHTWWMVKLIANGYMTSGRKDCVQTMNDLPKDPGEPLLENANWIHMIYKSYLRAGFNQEQALALCIGIIQETMRTATNET